MCAEGSASRPWAQWLAELLGVHSGGPLQLGTTAQNQGL